MSRRWPPGVELLRNPKIWRIINLNDVTAFLYHFGVETLHARLGPFSVASSTSNT